MSGEPLRPKDLIPVIFTLDSEKAKVRGPTPTLTLGTRVAGRLLYGCLRALRYNLHAFSGAGAPIDSTATSLLLIALLLSLWTPSVGTTVV